jgi:hypothetical protein
MRKESRIRQTRSMINYMIVQHTRLVNEIEEIDYAPPTLKQVESQLAGVTKQLSESKGSLKKLEQAT